MFMFLSFLWQSNSQPNSAFINVENMMKKTKKKKEKREGKEEKENREEENNEIERKLKRRAKSTLLD